jgi:hypothetical protein
VQFAHTVNGGVGWKFNQISPDLNIYSQKREYCDSNATKM